MGDPTSFLLTLSVKRAPLNKFLDDPSKRIKLQTKRSKGGKEK
jgi:hypothetical protein